MKILILTFLILALTLSAQSPTSTQMGYTYSLAADTTNATLGVKDSTGSLIRTIFHGRPRNAGTYTGIWDGLTDTGSTATGGPFSIVLLYGNPTYTFDGLVGDTGQWTGFARWGVGQEYMAYAKMTFIGNTGWITQGSAEGTNGLMYFSDKAPNVPNVVSPSYTGQDINLVDIDNDGQYLYMITASCFSGAVTWATKFDGLTGRPVMFTNGTNTIGGPPATGGAIVYAYPGTIQSNIDINAAFFDHPPTAIAAQKGGNILAVAHGNWYTACNPTANPTINTNNVIKFFDKTTGLPVGTNATLANPTSMGFDPSGNLWVIGNNTLNMISGVSGANTITQPIAGLLAPVAVGVGKVNGHIYVLDGGTSQQLKEFDTGYNLVRTYGVPGGYTDCNPTVAPNRLMVDNTAINATGGVSSVTSYLGSVYRFVRPEDNGDVWFLDTLSGPGSARIEHITPNGAGFNFVEHIFHHQEQYWMAASHTQPNRLFMNYLEYAFDYTKPNLPGDPQGPNGNGSWRLVRTWAVGAGGGGACGSNATFIANTGPLSHYSWFSATEQFSNGHVYGVINGYNATGPTMVELPASGTTPMRIIGNQIGGTTVWLMARDGSFYTFGNVGATSAFTATVSHIPLTGFDGNNNPTYGTAVAVATAGPYNTATDLVPYPAYGSGFGIQMNYEPTTGGTYAAIQLTSHNASTTTNFPHVGGLAAGRSTYLFTVLPEVCSAYLLGNGSYPCLGQSNPGPGIITEGRSIIVPFVANAAGNQYGPMYWHYWEDGMYVGQFGPWGANDWNAPIGANSIPTTAGVTNFIGRPYNQACGTQCAQPYQALGYTENGGSARVTTVNGDMYMFMDGESGTAPISVWRIANLSSIHEMAGTGNLGQSVAVNTPVF